MKHWSFRRQQTEVLEVNLGDECRVANGLPVKPLDGTPSTSRSKPQEETQLTCGRQQGGKDQTKRGKAWHGANRMVKMRLFLLACSFVVFSTLADAHGGGLDSLGCHHDHKHGGYHCHRGPLAGRSFASKSDAIRALQAQEGGQSLQQPSTSHIQSQAQPAPQTDREERTVYVTRTGKKYHGPHCQYLSRSKIPISLKEAREQGYKACSRCGGR